MDGGVIAGNVENKYDSKNPVARRLMRGFLEAVTELALKSGCRQALEVGCGEGRLSLHLARAANLTIRGTDFSEAIIQRARENARAAGMDDVDFATLDLDRLDPSQTQSDLVVCCEVLEHLKSPEVTLRQLVQVASKRILLSVPREPLWRALNVARGKYLGNLGNTPGHLNHWSARAFVRFVDQHAQVLEVRQPLPWTVVLAAPRPERGM